MSLYRSSKPSAASARTANATAQGPVTPNASRQTTTDSTPSLYSKPLYLLPGESPEAFAQLHDSLRAQWNPIGFCEDELVAELAGNLWQTQRVQTAQAQLRINCARRLDTLHRIAQRLTGMLVRLQKRGAPRPLPAGATLSPTASSRPPFIRREG
jgi:hypothetical protein